MIDINRPGGEWLVWFSLGGHPLEGLCIGGDPSREAALEDALAALDKARRDVRSRQRPVHQEDEDE